MIGWGVYSTQKWKLKHTEWKVAGESIGNKITNVAWGCKHLNSLPIDSANSSMPTSHPSATMGILKPHLIFKENFLSSFVTSIEDHYKWKYIQTYFFFSFLSTLASKIPLSHTPHCQLPIKARLINNYIKHSSNLNTSVLFYRNQLGTKSLCPYNT